MKKLFLSLVIFFAFVLTGLISWQTVCYGSNTVSESNNIEKVEDVEYILDAHYGERAGIYTGEVINGIPNGYGSFTAKNPAGTQWIYTGSFIDGHFNGQGATIWKGGQKEEGFYKNDLLNGEGKLYGDDGVLIYEGSFIDGEPEFLTNSQMHDMLTNANAYANCKIRNLPIKIHNIIGNIGNNEFQFQGYALDENGYNTFLVSNEVLDVQKGDYVLVTGNVHGMYDTTNAFGVSLSLPVIVCTEVEQADSTIFNPSMKTIEVNQMQEQNGLSVKLQRVEIAKKSTRVYLYIENNTGSKAGIYTTNSYIVQSKRQYYKSDISYNENSIESDMVDGTIQDAILSFQPLNIEDEGIIKIGLYAHSNDYSQKFEDFIFEIEP